MTAATSDPRQEQNPQHDHRRALDESDDRIHEAHPPACTPEWGQAPPAS